jgi:hypothetical protein
LYNLNVKQFIFARLHVGGMGIWMNQMTEELNFHVPQIFSLQDKCLVLLLPSGG